MRILATVAALACFALPARASEVWIVLSGTGPAYAEAAQAAELYLSSLAKTHRTGAEALRRSDRPASAVLTLGTSAFRAAIASDNRAPVIAALIPRAAYRIELKGARRAPAAPVTAVFLDQPIGRQLDLVHLLLPSKKRIGVLVSPATQDMLGVLQPAASARGLVLAHETVSDPQQIAPSLSRLLEGTDLLLAVPDPSIYNAGTIHNILLSALRVSQPLIGFSEAYVRAGALAAVYSRPQDAGRQAAEIVARAIAGVALPPPQEPRAFTVRVNEVLARSLGLAVDTEDSIAETLQRMERER